MISFKHRGNFKKTEKFLSKTSNINYMGVLTKYGQAGVEALANATPKDSGKTANGWGFIIERVGDKTKIVWTNSHINDGVCIALILQYGHGTGGGGYVEGADYINPAIRPIFDQIVEEAWKEVTRA